MNQNAIETYLGFALKAQKIIIGLDNIKKYNKKSYLLILCYSAGNSLKRESVVQSARLKTPLYLTKNIKLDELLHTENCKFILLKNKELTTAILEKNNSLKLFEEVKTV